MSQQQQQQGFSRKKKSPLNIPLVNSDANSSINSVERESNSSFIRFADNTSINSNIDNRRGSLPTSEYLTSNPLKKNGSITDTNTSIRKTELNGWDIIIFMDNPQYEVPTDVEGKTIEDCAELTPTMMYDRLISGGLEVFCYKSWTEKYVIFKVRSPIDVLMDYAEYAEMSLLLDSKKVSQIDSKVHPICDNPHISKVERYSFLHAPYTKNNHKYFKYATGCDHPFNPSLRTKITITIMESSDPHSKHACGLDMDTYKEEVQIVAYFPCHDKSSTLELKRLWFSCSVQPWEQPIDEIKDYFGEKIALYFEFLGHYTTWLLGLAIAGIVMELDIIIQSSTGKSYNKALLDGYLAPFFAVFISYWSQFMLEYWKRKECYKTMEWGTSEFESVERERPDFIGELQPSVINGKMTKFFPPDEATKRKHYSSFIIVLMILLVIGCVSFIFYLQVLVTRSSNVTVQSFGSVFTSVLNAVQIQVLNIVYEKIAVTLTKNENYRTDTAFEDALIAKLFSFQFVNSYASFYYIAFVKYLIVKSKCADAECSIMYELGFNLAIVFFIRLCVSKVQSFLTLYVNTGLKEKSDQEEFAKFVKANPNKSNRKKSKPEYEFNLEEYDSLMGTLSNYAELAVQFGYVTLFVVAFPLAPLMAYISNLVEFRSDGYQLLFMNRRVLPVGCQDIGTWMSIFQTMAIISVVTNSAIVCFTMRVLPISLAGKVWVFIGLQYFIFSSMALFEYLIEDVPYEVSLQLQRQEYICERLEEDDLDQLEEVTIKRRNSTKAVNTMIVHDDDAATI